MSTPTDLARRGMYAKKANAKATIGEAQGLAKSAVVPVIITARFAVLLSVVAVVISGVALVVVLVR